MSADNNGRQLQPSTFVGASRHDARARRSRSRRTRSRTYNGTVTSSTAGRRFDHGGSAVRATNTWAELRRQVRSTAATPSNHAGHGSVLGERRRQWRQLQPHLRGGDAARSRPRRSHRSRRPRTAGPITAMPRRAARRRSRRVQLFGADTASFVQVFDSRNAGSRTLTASGSVSDGNNGGNYSLTFVGASGTISPAQLTITAVSDNKVFDGTAGSAAFGASDGPQRQRQRERSCRAVRLGKCRKSQCCHSGLSP